jgi:hypothetical protein
MSAWRTGKERDAETGRASKRKVNPSNRNPLKYRCCTVTISFETQAITAWPELAQGCSMLPRSTHALAEHSARRPT